MLRAADKFPLIYANLQRHIFIPILPRMIDLLAENGVLLLSGILDTEEQAIRQAIAKYPLVLEKVSHEDEWVLLVTKKCRRNPPKLPSFAECRRNFSATTRR
ncbi:MAG: 50S ribosomal protein L11 methyltransferase [bacterium]